MIDQKSGAIFKYVVFIFLAIAATSTGRAQTSASASSVPRATDSGVSRCDNLLNTFLGGDARRPGSFSGGLLVMEKTGRSAPTTNSRTFEQSVEVTSRLTDGTQIPERIVFSRTSFIQPSSVSLRIQRTDPASTTLGVRGRYLEAAQTQTDCSLSREGTIQRSPLASSVATVDISYDRPFCDLLIAKLPRITAALSAAQGTRCELENGSVQTTPDDCAYRLVAETYGNYNRRLARSSGTRGSENFQLSRYMDYSPSAAPRTITAERNDYAVMRGAIYSCQTSGAPAWSSNFLTYLERLAEPNANFSFRQNRPEAPAGNAAPGAATQIQ